MSVVVDLKTVALLAVVIGWGGSIGCSTLAPEDADPQFLPEDQNHASPENSPNPDTEEPSDTSGSGTSGSQGEQGDQGSSSEPEPEPESEPETEPDPEKRDCTKITWGQSLREGEVVPKGEAMGFLDADGDNEVEKVKTPVGMCQLHQTGKACGLVFYARKT